MPGKFQPRHDWKGEHQDAHGSKWDVPYEKPGVPRGEAYGIAAVTQALEGLDFPASKQQILQRVRDHETIRWSKEKTVNLRTIFIRVEKDEFENMAGIVSVVSQEARQEGLTEDAQRSESH